MLPVQVLERGEYMAADLDVKVELIRRYGVPTLAIALNGQGMNGEELIAAQERLQEELGIPVIRPLEEGVEELVPVVRGLMK